MPELDDIALLKQFAENGYEPAFAEIVSRHVNLVYSAALRKVGDAHAAREISQAVFIILARKPKSLGAKTVLSGWLHQTTRLTAANYLRGEIRRQKREQEAFMQSTLNEDTNETWLQIAPVLDDAISRLGAKDRDVIVLRFFENKSLDEVGAAMNTSEDAAKMRVNRALEKLRKFFAKRGGIFSAAAIAGAVSANSVQAAPVGLAKTISAVAIAKGAAATTSTLTLVKGALKIMTWTKVKMAIVAGVAVLLAVGTTTAVHEIRWYQNYSWRIKGIDQKAIANLPKWPPQVWIKQPISMNEPNNLGLGPNGMIMGRAVPLSWLIKDAYGKSQPWMIFKDGLTDDHSYDFMANLPQGSSEALQREINKTLGISIRRQVIETNALLLKIGKGGVHGLQNPDFAAGDMLVGNGTITWFAKPLSTLDVFLELYVRIPIVDQTGLTNIYKYSIPWNTNWRFGSPQILDELKPNLLDKLGLELVPTNMPIEMLVVEKPN